ncbi:hypothetical protein NA57DRAFT_62042 [Rhizodiscina lignyota]|uniref:Uncharacterized protein n=1 Tax=Rhizodiscina lignyota TaxID=1504668 RepID=A0A9P4I590_9PEZI|nr:hypothetical protein NA57DRAFT_62042 [Rhizodiscina lignyota]
MSSEQRYDYFFEHFLNESIADAFTFGETPATSTSELLHEKEMVDQHQDRQFFYDDTNTSNPNPEFESLGEPGYLDSALDFNNLAEWQPSASNVEALPQPNVVTNVTGSNHTFLGTGCLRDYNDTFSTFATGTAGCSAAWGDNVYAHALETPDMGAVQQGPASGSYTEPIDGAQQAAPYAHDESNSLDGTLPLPLHMHVGPSTTPMPAHAPKVDINVEWSGPQKCCTHKKLLESDVISEGTRRLFTALVEHIHASKASVIMCSRGRIR